MRTQQQSGRLFQITVLVAAPRSYSQDVVAARLVSQLEGGLACEPRSSYICLQVQDVQEVVPTGLAPVDTPESIETSTDPLEGGGETDIEL